MADKSFKIKNSLNLEPQAAPPSNPSLGDLYMDTSGQLSRWDGVAWTSVGGSNGASGINYFAESGVAWSFEDNNTVGWTTYANAAGPAPVDGTGGSPNVTFTASGVAPLRGTYSAKFTKDGPNRQGQGVAAVVDIPEADRGKPLQFSFDSSGTVDLANGDMVVFAYDVTNGALLPGSWPISAGKSTTRGWFLCPTNCEQIRFILHVATTKAAASYILTVDNFQFNNGQYIAGPSIQDPITVNNPTFGYEGGSGSPTFTSNTYNYYVSGSTVTIVGVFSISNIASRVGNFGPVLPFTPSSTKQNTAVVGYWTLLTGSTADFQAARFGFTPTRLFFKKNGATNGDLRIEKISLNLTYQYFVQYEVDEFSSNTQIATRAVEEYVFNTSTNDAPDTTSFGYGPQGGLVPNTLTANRIKTAQFQTTIQPTDLVVLEFQYAGSGPWCPVSEYNIKDVQAISYANTTIYGAGLDFSPGSDKVNIFFGKYAQQYGATTYGGAGGSWGTAYSAGTRYRVRKVSGGASVGFPVGARNIVGDTTGTAVPAGMIGETIQSVVSTSQNAAASSTWKALTSITLTPGTWLISATGQHQRNSATPTSDASIAIGTTPASATGNISGYTQLSVTLATITNLDFNTATIPMVPVNISSTTTYYLNVLTVYSAGTPQWRGTITAVRIA